jgi:hypothetical protein
MTMQDEFGTIPVNDARMATRPWVGAIIAATAFLAVLPSLPERAQDDRPVGPRGYVWRSSTASS